MRDRRLRAQKLHQELSLVESGGGFSVLFRDANLRATLTAFLFMALQALVLVVGESGRLSGTSILGIVTSVFIVHVAVGLYIVRSEAGSIRSFRELILLELLSLFVLLFARVAVFFSLEASALLERSSSFLATARPGGFLLYLIPVVPVASLLALGFSRRLAFAHAVGVGWLCALAVGIEASNSGPKPSIRPDATLFFTLLVGTALYVFNISRSSSYRRLKICGIISGVGMVVALLCGRMLEGDTLGAIQRDRMGELVAAFLSGVLTGLFLSEFGVSILESALDVLMDVRLLELRDLNRPIFRKFHLEASGTFHHTQAVAQMTEEAANAIGANGLLAYVGALYHDIGKIHKPEYFAENQGAGKHERLSPTLSALIVIAHVKDGVELARELELPERIIDFIPEHHGTQAVEFFYRKAVSDGLAVARDDFRYPGPTPQSKESAILLVADSLEAVSRTLDDPSPSRIRAVVRDTILEKLQAGQLDASPLTMRDLHDIEESFFRFLAARLHQRIKYPRDPGQGRITKDTKGREEQEEKEKEEEAGEGRITKGPNNH